MITELILFDLPEGITREQLLANYRKTAPKWRANADLIRKTYLHDAERRQGGGVYVWTDRGAAERWHDDAWRSSVVGVYGGPPTIRYFDTPLVVDNAAGEVVDEAAVTT